MSATDVALTIRATGSETLHAAVIEYVARNIPIKELLLGIGRQHSFGDETEKEMLSRALTYSLSESMIENEYFVLSRWSGKFCKAREVVEQGLSFIRTEEMFSKIPKQEV